jgi:hypothetical protein
MKRVRNDPDNYVKRSDLGPRRQDRPSDLHGPEQLQREKDYLVAPIDEAGYVDFSVPAKCRERSG